MTKRTAVELDDDTIRRAWSADTSASPDEWTPENPALGQCAVTALVIQDRWGGDLLRGMVGDVSHYWNRLPTGDEIDLTREQFPPGSEVIGADERTREYVLSYAPTARRYALLRSRAGA